MDAPQACEEYAYQEKTLPGRHRQSRSGQRVQESHTLDAPQACVWSRPISLGENSSRPGHKAAVASGSRRAMPWTRPMRAWGVKNSALPWGCPSRAGSTYIRTKLFPASTDNAAVARAPWRAVPWTRPRRVRSIHTRRTVVPASIDNAAVASGPRRAIPWTRPRRAWGVVL